MGSKGSKVNNEEKTQQNIVYNNIINNGTINYNVQNNVQFQNYQPNNVQYQNYEQNNFKPQIQPHTIKPSNCCCPLCGEEFLKGRFINSGESKDYYDCWKCGRYQNDKYYFKCKNCENKFCTDCPKKVKYIPNYSCPLCGEEFLRGNGMFKSSGESKDYYNCRKCGSYKSDKYYFKCKNCGSKFCTKCPENNTYIPNYSCPLCGEEFSRGHGRFINSGESKDYFDCRKCGSYKSDKYYFKCKNCGSKFCTKCPENNTYIPNYSCPLCGEQFSRGHGRFENCGESKDYYDCRKCGRYQNDKYYFKCKNCGSKFCTSCSQN